MWESVKGFFKRRVVQVGGAFVAGAVVGAAGYAGAEMYKSKKNNNTFESTAETTSYTETVPDYAETEYAE